MFIEHPNIKARAIEKRQYQVNIAKSASTQSTLVVLPTGMGKTIVALMVMAEILKEKNCVVDHISAPGTFVRFLDPELLKKLVNHTNEYQDYVDFAEKFDSDPSVLGVGAVNAGGLLITAKKY